MKKAKGEFIFPLREHCEHMMTAHITFLFVEIFVYPVMPLAILTEIFYFWLCYFCYMTLKFYAFYAYILLLGLAPLYSIWTMLTIGPIKMLFYFIQLFVYSYFGGYVMFLRYRNYAQELNEYEQEKKNRRTRAMFFRAYLFVLNESRWFGKVASDRRRLVLERSAVRRRIMWCMLRQTGQTPR